MFLLIIEFCKKFCDLGFLSPREEILSLICIFPLFEGLELCYELVKVFELRIAIHDFTFYE